MLEIKVGQKWKFRHSNYCVKIAKKLNAKCWEAEECDTQDLVVMNSEEIFRDYVISKDKQHADRR